jgi:hypothetical protein
MKPVGSHSPSGREKEGTHGQESINITENYMNEGYVYMRLGRISFGGELQLNKPGGTNIIVNLLTFLNL